VKLEVDQDKILLDDVEEAFHQIEKLHYLPTVPHEHAVGKYMYFFAKSLNINEEKAKALSFAGKLHDIGKIKIPITILDKAGPLNAPQRKKIEKHTEIGYNILKIIDHPLMQLSATLALHHHENFDGSGYPEGLSGNEIPIECRLGSICDVYDVLRNRRSYKKRFSHQDAVDFMIDKTKGGLANKFDPELLQEFEKSHQMFERLYLLESTSV